MKKRPTNLELEQIEEPTTLGVTEVVEVEKLTFPNNKIAYSSGIGIEINSSKPIKKENYC